MHVHDPKFSEKLKEELKKFRELTPPAWSFFAKSGAHRERPPEQPDFWYWRAASILRRIYLRGPIGVERLRKKYGGRKRRGVKPARFAKASGSLLRKILQQLEEAKLLQKTKKGREITTKGKELIKKLQHGD